MLLSRNYVLFRKLNEQSVVFLVCEYFETGKIQAKCREGTPSHHKIVRKSDRKQESVYIYALFS